MKINTREVNGVLVARIWVWFSHAWECTCARLGGFWTFTRASWEVLIRVSPRRNSRQIAL